MQKLIRTLGYAALALSLAGCHLVYTPDVAQGNLFDKTIDKNLADQLKPGLTKRQVLVLLGTPSVSTPFNQNRWDYVSTYSHRGEKMKVNAMSLYFNNDVLVRTEGTCTSRMRRSWCSRATSTRPSTTSTTPPATRRPARAVTTAAVVAATMAAAARTDRPARFTWRVGAGRLSDRA